MSKEKSSSTEPSETQSPTVTGKRRPAKSRSQKTTKSVQAPKPSQAESVIEKALPSYPVFDTPESAPEFENPEPASSGGQSSQEGVKRNKRRRKKGKGTGSQASLAEAPSESAGKVTDRSHPKLDPDSVAKLALKIYLAEVSEEGVALVGDSDAKELARRCFRLSEIFMEEQSRRR